MPPPVTGSAVALAATQMRIIELDTIVDNNISDSMVFAIDFPNQTYKITGLQFRTWLSTALVFEAENVGFDPAVLLSLFSPATPPDTVQGAIDFGMPILANADAGNIGKPTSITLADLNLTVRAGFYRTSNSTLNIPTSTSSDGFGSVIVAAYTGDDVFQLWNPNYGSSNLYYRRMSGGIWGAWVTLADSSDLDAYLPLSGGSLSGPLSVTAQNAVIEIKRNIINAEMYLAYRDELSQTQGLIGFIGGKLALRTEAGTGLSVDITGDSAVNLNAPTVNVNGDLVTDSSAVLINVASGDLQLNAVSSDISLNCTGNSLQVSNVNSFINSSVKIDLNAPAVNVNGLDIVPVSQTKAGDSPIDNAGVAVVFATPYPNANYAVNATASSNLPSPDALIIITNKTAAGFTMSLAATGASTANWITTPYNDA